MKSLVLVLSTFPNKRICKTIARQLVKRQLAACCNYWPVNSSYVWQGKIEESKEILMFIKTTRKNYKNVESFLRKNHPYQLPEIIALSINRGERKFLAWLIKGVSDA